MSADEHRTAAREADHRALRAHTRAESRELRRIAAEHRLNALLTEYRLTDSPP